MFDRAIPGDLEQGIKGPGFPIEVFNVLGAGDAFMSGFLRGYLRDLPLEESWKYANACGAFAVSRHGCAPAVPSWTELQDFFAKGSTTRALRKDARLEQIHWATTRTRHWPQLLAMAFDHRAQLEAMADAAGITREHVAYLKQLCLRAARQAAGGRADFGILLDGTLGQEALDDATGDGMWIGRPIEEPGAIPLRFEGGADVGCTLREWPVTHCVKCLVFYHPDDPEALRAQQEAQLLRLADAARQTSHELLLEIIPSRSAAAVDEATLARALERLYALGIFPDWWKLPDPGERGGVAGDRRGDRAPRSLVPGRAAARPRRAAGGARGELGTRRAPAGVQGLRDRPHDLRRPGARLDGRRDRRRHRGRAHGRGLCGPDRGVATRPRAEARGRWLICCARIMRRTATGWCTG